MTMVCLITFIHQPGVPMQTEHTEQIINERHRAADFGPPIGTARVLSVVRREIFCEHSVRW
jgi:hypothetical protein